MTHEKHPDTPEGGSVDEELNQPTRESMDRLGRTDLAEAPDPEAREGDDESPPGQNSDWLPQ